MATNNKAVIKKKNYEVLITGFCTVLVISAESKERALEYATNECSFGDFQMDEARIERVVADDELDNVRANADCVADVPDDDFEDEANED